ncbi:hypothetical protein GKA01_05090 [Gluconobacter kanchanaburiensis NBRC 103587]|uniref:Uncharacterized protein n=1 Tax=Gluconobacter kanchanaburiensis NBRC 103587 TaxID=1307948 RepID=A0A511B6K7_9PROT|nr:hypothetical protein AA103587_0161 [Gluconobacter kanchanaburiensis NBRC 103587]GEK95312.1 hypothetical protein GKA01_05090 [Gluconobacter kanchanaburiensis NBRC 103587]
MALIAAVCAVWLSKKAADIANENSTFISFSNLSETKSENVNSQLIKLREIMKTFHDKIREEKSAGLNVGDTCASCWQGIRQSSEEINQSFHSFKNKVNFSKISSESKDNLILYFLESIKTDLVWEFLSKYLTRSLFENAPVNFPPPEEIYKNYVDIATAMKEKNLHTDLFEEAELINGPYLRD